MAYVRVNPAEPVCVVAHPLTGEFITPNRSAIYEDTDLIVKAYPWLFATESAIVAAEIARKVDSVNVESATARPGEARQARYGRSR